MSEHPPPDDSGDEQLNDHVRAIMSPAPPEDKVVCRECYEPLGQITASHLSFHGMTTDDYREKYPDAPFQSPSVRREGGWSEKGHTAETRKRIAEAIKRKHKNGEYDHADA